MARTALTPVDLPSPYATTPSTFSFVAADVANGNQFAHSGKEIVLVRNTHGSDPQNVSITSSPDLAGRVGDITNFSIAAGGYRAFQMFPVLGWRQSDGQLYINGANASIEIAVLRVPN